MTTFRTILACVIAGHTLFAQTKVDLGAQGRNIDFAAAASTRPARTGNTLPTQCAVGELFFKLNAPDGSNVYGCTAPNIWTLQSSTGTVPADGASGNLLGTNGTTPAWQIIGGDITGPITGATVVGLAGRGVSSTAPTSGQILKWNASTNKWEPANGGSGGGGSYSGGVGIAVDSNVISADDSVVPLYFAGSGVPSVSCKAGRDFYTDTASMLLYFCGADDTWKLAGGGLPGVTANTIADPQSCVDSGALNAYSCSLNPAITAYQNNAHYRFRAVSSNSGPSSVAFNGLAALPITKYYNNSLDANDIRAGQWVEVVYDGSRFQMQSQTGNQPASSGSAFRRFAYVAASGSSTIQTLGDFFTVGAGTISSVPLNSDGALINMATAASSGAQGYWAGAGIWQTGSNISYKVWAKAVDLSNVRHWLGFFSGSSSTFIGNDTVPTGHLAGFRYSSGTDTSWACVTRDGTTQHTVPSGVAADNTAHLFEISFTGNGAFALFKIDGNPVCGSPLTVNLPDVNTGMYHHVGVGTKDATAKSIRFGWAYLQTDK